jgi:molybdopterin synthase catalytic subunit
VRVQTADFDVGQEIKSLQTSKSDIGAIVTFIGQVRDFNADGTVSSLSLEHYPGMTEKVLSGIEDDARRRWSIIDSTIVHRVGDLAPSDQIVLVIVASHHRGEAFLACEYIMDYLKTSAPFWKKELSESGSKWVDAKQSDDLALSKWD